jgi:molybdate transport system ATP-binding protein
VFEGTVIEISTGASGIVDVAISVGSTTLRSRITRRAAEQLGLARGSTVYALVKAVSLSRAGSP